RGDETWRELSGLLDRVDRRGVTALSAPEIKRLTGLYRQVTIELSRTRSAGEDPARIRYLNQLAARAHGRVYSTGRVDLRPALEFIAGGFARLVRKRWRAVTIAAATLFLAALASAIAVVHNPALAYSLFDEQTVEFENIRIEHQHGEYRGNFTFPAEFSP